MLAQLEEKVEAKVEAKVEVKAEEKAEEPITAAMAGEKRPRSESPDTAVKKQKSTPEPTDPAPAPTAAVSQRPVGKPPVFTLCMTVTSGFYVRSLIHDLGKALGTEAHMVKLVRTRQSDYAIGNDNVLEWEELMENPEEVWGPKVEGLLRKWAEEKAAKR